MHSLINLAIQNTQQINCEWLSDRYEINNVIVFALRYDSLQPKTTKPMLYKNNMIISAMRHDSMRMER